MFNKLFFLFVSNVLVSKSNGYNFDSFNNYIENYDKTYNSINEYMYRFKIFTKNLDRIDYVNTNNYTYKLGINKFTDLSFYEFSNNFKGYNGLYYNKDVKYYHKLTLPKNDINSIDWRRFSAKKKNGGRRQKNLPTNWKRRSWHKCTKIKK